MTRERWRQVKAIVAAAMDMERAVRAEFVIQECGGDDQLRSEVEALLMQHASNQPDPLDRQPWRIPIPSDRAWARRFLRGDTLLNGRFRIQETLGSGGMGEVYAAFDNELRERVALKMIRSDLPDRERLLDRLRREVQQARRIAHPNVCRVYDLFTDIDSEGRSTSFLTMELLEGETLTEHLHGHGALPEAEALPLIEQMGEALDAAHRLGIVHRDFKPGNVFLRSSPPGGMHAVVTDFGLARTLGQTTAHSESQIAGTPAYMAPEQIEGGEITPAADIYALGIVAYEMVTGRQPFEAASPLASAARRLTTPPPPPRTLAPHLAEVWDAACLQCLERDPVRRFARAGEFAHTLRNGWDPRLGARFPMRHVFAAVVFLLLLALGAYWFVNRGKLGGQSVAIIPFGNATGDAEMEYLSDGISDQIVQSLRVQPGLTVTPRNSAYRFKGARTPRREIGRQLGVAALLTGAIERHGDGLRITASLVEAASERIVWSKTFDRSLGQIFSLPGEVAGEVVGSLAMRQASGVQRSPPATSNPVALDFCLRGDFCFAKRDPENLHKALRYYEEAARLQPDLVRAHIGLAHTLSYLVNFGQMDARDAMPRAKEAAMQALTLDSKLSDAHAAWGLVNSFFDLDWRTAERSFQRAQQLDPRNVTAMAWYSGLLIKLARVDKAVVVSKEALDIDPLSMPLKWNYAGVLYFDRRYADAIREFHDLQDFEPGYAMSNELLAESLARLRRREEALSAIKVALDSSRNRGLALGSAGIVHALLGDPAGALAYARRLAALQGASDHQAVHVARIYAELGDKDAAFHWLEQGYDQREIGVQLIKVYPSFDGLRRDPRYESLVRKLNF